MEECLPKNQSTELFRGKKLIIKTMDCSYRDPKTGAIRKIRNYEFTEWVTRPAHSEIDGATIVPILKYADGTTKLVLIDNYRPKIDKTVIEFPSGQLDLEEYSIDECCRREMLEETGYNLTEVYGWVPKCVIHNTPWDSNEADNYFVAEIDLGRELPENVFQFKILFLKTKFLPIGCTDPAVGRCGNYQCSFDRLQ